MGRHVEALTDFSNITLLLKLTYVGEIMFVVGTSATKLSVLCFYLRIFTVRSRRFQWCFWITFTFVSGYSAFMIPSTVAECVPLKKIWQPETPGKCLNSFANLPMVLTGTIWDSLSDLMILILPMPVISKLQMPRQRQATVLLTFFCGYL